MAKEIHYRIDYLLRGSYKYLYIRATDMDNEQAWNWAAVDAGLAQIPKARHNKTALISRATAETMGISDVAWSAA